MNEIIPTILVKSFKDVEQRINSVEPYVNWAQLDIMDGVFVDNQTFNNPRKVKNIKTKLNLEAHLMVQYPEKVFDDWLKVTSRVIFHYESKIQNRELGIRGMIDKAHQAGKQVGIAISPETDIAVTAPFLKDLDVVLIMTVQPGWGGQKFKSWTLEKVKALRRIWSRGNIEIDGGIDPRTAKLAAKAGANLICSGTYIFKSKNVKRAIEKLKSNI